MGLVKPGQTYSQGQLKDFLQESKSMMVFSLFEHTEDAWQGEGCPDRDVRLGGSTNPCRGLCGVRQVWTQAEAEGPAKLQREGRSERGRGGQGVRLNQQKVYLGIGGTEKMVATTYFFPGRDTNWNFRTTHTQFEKPLKGF